MAPMSRPPQGLKICLFEAFTGMKLRGGRASHI